MAEQRKWRLDKKLTAMMVEDMLFDPLLAARVILRVDVPPHEELRILKMWSTYYTNDDSGFSTGKSWTFALVSALRSILIKQRTSGILSKTFAQGKLIFKNFDNWYNESPIFRSCIKHAAGKARLVHASDAWSAHFRGGSEIRVLPPNFLQDAERIRSERWNDGYMDEWTTYGNFTALNTTIIGRITKVNPYRDCPVRQNHVHLASTPNFKHHPAYDLIKTVDEQVARGNVNYGRFTCNYRHIPKIEKWEPLVNPKIIYHMQCTLPKGIVRAEVDGIWSDDSGSYYSSGIVEQVRSSLIPITLRRINQNDIFVAGIDTAPGGGDTKADGSGDDFAISVLMISPKLPVPVHVCTIRRNRISDITMSGIVHRLHQLFGFSLIVSDPGGGGLFLQEKLRSTTQMIDNTHTVCTPIITPTDSSGTIGDQVLCSFSRGDFYISQAWGKMQSDSVLINRAHKDLKGAIENRNILLYGRWEGWSGNEASWNVGSKRRWLNNNPPGDDIALTKAEMDIAVSQLMLVDCDRNGDGMPVLDKYGMYAFGSKQKKDSAYSLVYAYTAFTLLTALHGRGILSGSPDPGNTSALAIEEI